MGTRLSVVVPTRNRKELVARLLGSLAKQTIARDEFEVIVVDDGSTDGTESRVSTAAAESGLRARCVRNPNRGTGSARNYGTQLSEAEFIAYMDDDVVCRDDCVANALSHFTSDQIGAVEATMLIAGTDEPLLKKSAAQGFITNAIFYRKSALDRIGGFADDFFDPDSGLFFRDDLDLGFRLLEAGYQAVHADDVVAWHPFIYHDLSACFVHARRYMVDPLLYRKHPRLFRTMLERKRIGPFACGRPLHRGCQLFGIGFVGIIAGWIARMPQVVAPAAALTLAGYMVVRIKFQGGRALHLWNLPETLAFVALPGWYVYWYVRGCLKFGGWKSMM